MPHVHLHGCQMMLSDSFPGTPTCCRLDTLEANFRWTAASKIFPGSCRGDAETRVYSDRHDCHSAAKGAWNVTTKRDTERRAPHSHDRVCPGELWKSRLLVTNCVNPSYEIEACWCTVEGPVRSAALFIRLPLRQSCKWPFQAPSGPMCDGLAPKGVCLLVLRAAWAQRPRTLATVVSQYLYAPIRRAFAC